jgi:hypothetical protein
MIIDLPNKRDTKPTYGVSPQPAQAPLNSKYGLLNCTPNEVLIGALFASCLILLTYSQLAS